MPYNSRDAQFRFFTSEWVSSNFEDLYHCYLLKMEDDPTQCSFNEITQLNGKNAVILHNEILYFANQKSQTVQLLITKDIKKWTQLKKEFTEDCKLVNDRFLIETITELTGYKPKPGFEEPLSYEFLMDFSQKFFYSPFTTLPEFLLQCIDSFNLTILSFLYVPFVAFCIAVVSIVTPFIVMYDLCFESAESAKGVTLHLLDMVVELVDAIIRAALVIPIHLGSLLARSALTFLPEPENEIMNSEMQLGS